VSLFFLFLFLFFLLHSSSYLSSIPPRTYNEEEEEELGVHKEKEMKSKLIYRSYISDANAQRKYEDGKALQEALNEIRAEIARVSSGAVR
jgi:hypothetical protein